MGIRMVTDERGIKVWRNDKNQFPTYSISTSKKNDEGKYENCYESVRFKGKVDIPNGTDIIIKDSFRSFNTGADGKKYPYWMITQYELMNDFVNNIPDGADEELPFN